MMLERIAGLLEQADPDFSNIIITKGARSIHSVPSSSIDENVRILCPLENAVSAPMQVRSFLYRGGSNSGYRNLKQSIHLRKSAFEFLL